jgi:ubiquinone/menaquinone biosynthesis C-methylase UbiE
MISLTSKELILEIGCKDFQTGDVNVDIRRPHRKRPNSEFILADGCFLPLIDNSFSIVKSSHTIEHTTDPALFLREIVRVSNWGAEIRCPHAFSPYYAKAKGHRWIFRPGWFKENCKALNVDCEVRTMLYATFLIEITCYIWKRPEKKSLISP